MAHLELSILWRGSTEQTCRPTYLKFENRRTICSSVSLRASTRVSSGFDPLRHSSASFGSRQACSHSNPSQKIKVDRRCNPRGDPVSQLPCALRVYSPVDSHTCQTPWSVFQDRPNGELAGRRRERADAEASLRARAASHDRGEGVSTGFSTARALASASICNGPHPESIGGPAGRRSTSDRGASPTPIRFPPDNFKHSLTLFSKSFSSFPCGTCLLSVARPYLALDGIYRPIRAAFPNNPTRRQCLVVRQGPGTTGLSPSPAPLSRGLGPGPLLRTLLQTTIRMTGSLDFQARRFPRLGDDAIASRQASRDGLDAREAMQRFVNHHSSQRVVRRGGLAFGPTTRGHARGANIRPQTCPQPNGFRRNLRSKTRWFAGFCNSHRVSHFATFFIDARAEISVAESRLVFSRDAARERALFVRVPWRDLRWGLLFRRGMAAAAPGGAPGTLPTGRGSRREGADGPPLPLPQRGKII
ncbi:hypothetical protein TEA_006765 [Camellia sinensis var. sinensis]|uniref:Uncharacterized protein n=1 Tax=Camellia sinensis var. sinensis TaxID=542762 RepID=A0A4S4D5L4_CAMSN|nr:hypothetical protein TEA_006765 [Camellia sinensis var. sinensis]